MKPEPNHYEIDDSPYHIRNLGGKYLVCRDLNQKGSPLARPYEIVSKAYKTLNGATYKLRRVLAGSQPPKEVL